MSWQAASDQLIRDVLSTSRVIAMVGASPNPARDSNDVMAFLLSRGYQVIPVNPTAAGQEIHGRRVVTSLTEIAEVVDIVDIFRNSGAAAEAVDEAVAIGAKAVWLQLGVINEEAAARAEGAGLKVIMDRCPKIEIPRLGIAGPPRP